MGEKALKSKLPLFAFLVCIVQPLLDVISYFVALYGVSNTVTLLLRCLILVSVFIIGFSVSNNKKAYYITAAVLILFTVCHISACIFNGYNDPVSDLINLVRIYQMPLYVICFMSFIKANDNVYKALRYGLVFCLLIICAVEALSVITNTNPYTYENKGIGIIGWFYDSSAQSAILSALVPVFLAAIISKFKNNIAITVIALLLSTSLLYFYATRLAYLTLIMLLVGFITVMLISDRKSIIPIVACTLALVTFVVLIPISPMEKNQSMVEENAIIKQKNIDGLIQQYEATLALEGCSEDGLKTKRLEGAYDYYLGGLVDRFGLEKTAEKYNYSEKASDICDVRRMKNTYCSMLMSEQGVTSMLFGMELSDLTYNGQVYDVENDLHGIFFLCGGIGLVLMIGFILYFVIRIITALFADFKGIFNIESASWAITLLAIGLHVYATCGVLRRPSSSFYLSVTLSVIPYLANKAKERTVK